MAAAVPLFRIMGVSESNLSNHELLILEAQLFICLYEELSEFFREKYKGYFRLIKLNKQMENLMIESNFVSFLVKDILSTHEYTLEGIAEYPDFHEDVILDVIAGKNNYPSSIFLKRVIELHRAVRSDLYKAIIKKILFDDINKSDP